MSETEHAGPADVTVPTGDGDLPGLLWLPPSGTGPGIVLLQEIFGVAQYVRDRAADLAAAGYVVLAPELYARLDRGPTVTDDMRTAMGMSRRLDWDGAVRDAAASLAWLRGRPEVRGGAGLMGFCYGGGLAFATAAVSAPDVLVSYYGSALPTLLDLAPDVRAPSLHHFGTKDAYLTPEVVDEIRAAVAGPDTEVHLHDGAGHAFDNPAPQFHHARASSDAWRLTTEFLARRLPVGRPGPATAGDDPAGA